MTVFSKVLLEYFRKKYLKYCIQNTPESDQMKVLRSFFYERNNYFFFFFNLI